MRQFIGAVAATLVASATLAIGTDASAALLFDNGGASVPGSGGTDLTQFTVADDFVLAHDALITGGTFDYDGLPTASLAGLTYFIYSNFDGVLYDAPGSLISTGLLTVTDRVYLGDPGYIPHSRATFTLETSFAATEGTHYWFGLRQLSDEGVSWTVTDFTPSHTSIRRDSDDPGAWRVFDYERPFSLTGTAVPEPATWALMIMGFGTAGAMLRRHTRGQLIGQA